MEQLLDREEALALQRLADSVQNLGERVCAMAESSARIRRHPFLATGLAALLGYVGGPRVLRGLGRMLQGGSSLRAVAEFVGAIERRMAG